MAEGKVMGGEAGGEAGGEGVGGDLGSTAEGSGVVGGEEEKGKAVENRVVGGGEVVADVTTIVDGDKRIGDESGVGADGDRRSSPVMRAVRYVFFVFCFVFLVWFFFMRRSEGAKVRRSEGAKERRSDRVIE